MSGGDARLAEAKAQRRRELRAVRRAISSDPGERAARSARIWAGVVPFLTGCRHVMIFRSMLSEPDTAGWYRWCADHGVAAYEPEVAGSELLVQPGDLDPRQLDAVIVPGLGFTADGRRLGQGRGYYDRFLPRLRPDCVVVAVGYAEQLVADLPTGPDDVAVPCVVTDAGVTQTAR